jgi:hypothetical protein
MPAGGTGVRIIIRAPGVRQASPRLEQTVAPICDAVTDEPEEQVGWDRHREVAGGRLRNVTNFRRLPCAEDADRTP